MVVQAVSEAFHSHQRVDDGTRHVDDVRRRLITLHSVCLQVIMMRTLAILRPPYFLCVGLPAVSLCFLLMLLAVPDAMYVFFLYHPISLETATYLDVKVRHETFTACRLLRQSLYSFVF